MSKRSIQVDFSTNCSAAVLESKPVINGIVTARPSSAPISATQRAVPGFLSLPTASTRRPKTIGSQIAVLRIGKACISVVSPPYLPPSVTNRVRSPSMPMIMANA